jgi:hypothetical protein
MSAFGTFETWRDLRVESAFEGKAEVGLRGRQGSFWTRYGHWEHRGFAFPSRSSVLDFAETLPPTAIGGNYSRTVG